MRACLRACVCVCVLDVTALPDCPLIALSVGTFTGGRLVRSWKQLPDLWISAPGDDIQMDYGAAAAAVAQIATKLRTLMIQGNGR